MSVRVIFSALIMYGLVTASNLQAQIISDSITYVPRGLGYELYQGPMEIGTNRVKALTKKCDKAWKVYHAGQQMESFGTLMVIAGIAFSATAIGNHYFNDASVQSAPFVFASLSMIAVGIPLQRSGVHKVKKATAIYNSRCVDP